MKLTKLQTRIAFGTIAAVAFAAAVIYGIRLDKIEAANKFIEINTKHELRRFNVKTTTSESAHASYFLFMGDYSSNKSEKTTVRFYLKNCLGEYQFMEREIGEIRIKIDSTPIPYVTIFSYSGPRCYSLGKYDHYSVIIHCKEGDFQPEININSLR